MMILEAHYNLLEAIERYLQIEAGDVVGSISVIRCRAWRLFTLLKPALERRAKTKSFKQYEEILGVQDFDKLLTYTYNLCGELDKLGLTKIDTRPVYDRARVEQENKAKGLD